MSLVEDVSRSRGGLVVKLPPSRVGATFLLDQIGGKSQGSLYEEPIVHPEDTGLAPVGCPNLDRSTVRILPPGADVAASTIGPVARRVEGPEVQAHPTENSFHDQRITPASLERVELSSPE